MRIRRSGFASCDTRFVRPFTPLFLFSPQRSLTCVLVAFRSQQPIDFLEFVTLVHARGIKCKGWQISLKKWLDGQCITYFTEEQTGPRSRH